jgi:hypothetical protein
MKCLKCKNRLFFKPLPDETFTCCLAWGEGVQNINIRTGVSPAIKKYGLDGNPCGNFKPGISICQTDESGKSPFLIHPIRREGEKFLHQQLGVK